MEIATHSSSLTWESPWTEEPGGLQFMHPQRVGHDWATKRREEKLGGQEREPQGGKNAQSFVPPARGCRCQGLRC